MPLEIADAEAPAGARYSCTRCPYVTNSEELITAHVLDGQRCRFAARGYHDAALSAKL